MSWARAAVFAFAISSATVADAQSAARDFPFERELLLQATPMRPGKRMPSLTIGSDGRAVIDLWCRSVPGRVELGEGTIAVTSETGPQDLMQTALPAMMSAGQCTEPRMAADADLLSALVQTNSWRQDGDIVVLNGGPMPLRFRPAGN